jgi:DNA end-binding protein Ku
MWRGAISFGMVAIPVRLYLATESKSVSFRMLCPDCGHPIRNKRWCANEDKEVPWNATVRGFEVGKDEFVVLEDSDLEALPLTTSHTCEILEFVHDEEIEAGVYIKGAYYLEPESVGVKPYYLLKAALEQTGKVAVGKIAFRDREHLCRLALHEKGLLLNTLHWPDEIRNPGELSLPEDEARPEIHKRELDMAVMLVENLSAEFDPARYRDDYREALMQVVEAKVSDTPLTAQTPERPSKVTDLMAALKASVEAAQTGERRQRADGTHATAARKRQASSDGARRRKAS